MSYPRLVSDCNTPRIQWYQTDLTVIICIQLIDVEKYYLRVEDDRLLFSTIKDNKDYCLILYLFGGVIAERTTHRNTGREIRVNLIKTLKWFPWLRLTLSDERNPLISYDAQHVDETHYSQDIFNDIEEDKNDEKKPVYRDMNLMPAVPSSDEEDFDYEEYDFFCE